MVHLSVSQVSALESLSAHERVAWVLETFPHEEILVTSSFGIDSAAFLHVLREVDPGLPIGFIDTGFLFPETLAYRDRLAERLGLRVVSYAAPTPEQGPPEHPGRANGDGAAWCACRKVEAMAQALEGKSCWISGLRRDSAGSRHGAPVLELQRRGLHKLHPIADWSHPVVMEYLRRHRLPLHPLAGQGYTSVGCMPCTHRPRPGEGPRSGRWPGQERDECGIHSFLRRAEAQEGPPLPPAAGDAPCGAPP